MGIDSIISGGIQGLATIGGAIARRRAMNKATNEIKKSSKEQMANIDKQNAVLEKDKNANGMQLASTQHMLTAINNAVAKRRKQNNALVGMGLMSEGTAEQLSQGDETANLASKALVEQQSRADAARDQQQALMAEKNGVISSTANSLANLHKAQGDAIAQAASSIGQQASGMIKKA